jgi:hypothetical protein
MQPRLFHLQRNTDITGASGTGRVADGVLWPDHTVTIRWHGEYASTVVWDNLDHAIRVHGHDGATQFVFDDETETAEPDRMPGAEWSASWQELLGYVQEARASGGQIDPGELLTYLGELRHKALAPVTAWIRTVGTDPAGADR